MITAILQARMGSTRLPGKSLKIIQGKPMLWHVIARLKKSKKIDRIVIATTTQKADDAISKLANECNAGCYRGSVDDVLGRYFGAIKEFGGDVVVRVTADCPLLDPEVIDRVISEFLSHQCDYASNVEPPTYPDGLDVEVFSKEALAKANANAKLKSEREHVTPYITNNKFLRINVAHPNDLSDLRWTVDNPEDLEFVTRIYELLGAKASTHEFTMNDILGILRDHPDLLEINKNLTRNEGYAKSLLEEIKMSKGVQLWNKAKKLIPGGSQLLSKRSELYLPDQWPSYYSKAKGVEIWDLDDRKYVDMSSMGIGSCILGYADPDVNGAVKKAIDLGSMSSLNCYEEVDLAEKLIKLNPWAQMVRYTRTAGEALAVAVRIARAHTGKDKVAICGYHGWHDWYLAANLADEKGLDGHLLPGLLPAGVPRGLTGTTIPFEFNRADQLEDIVAKHSDVGTIVVEPIRHHNPAPGFFKKVREIADRTGAVLLVDETSAGWRKSLGGMHSMLGLRPDLAVYGKAMSNGFPMAAVIGKAEVMDAAQISFISSTYWTERIGPTAALATIAKLESQLVAKHVSRIGLKIGDAWKKLAQEVELEIDILADFEPLISFEFKYGDKNQAISTLLTQEMLDRGYLGGTSVYVCHAHTDEVVEAYLEPLSKAFREIKKAIDSKSVEKKLRGPIAHSGFKRLTS